MGKHPSITIAVAALAAVTLVVALAKPSQHRLLFKCYFDNAQGLRPGAHVRLGGVEIGSVASVRVRPEFRDRPAEVTMLLQTSYPLDIPNDAVVSLETAGVLGEVFPQIDIRGASGPALLQDGILKTRAGESPTPEEWLECFSNVVAHKPCDLRGQRLRPNPVIDEKARSK
ncbi:MAG TPA: MlaD family protein [Candidatus Angelobacter sp.]|nr:MlaD family protein [Candidatus Angelobacter sp.]